MQKIDNRYEPVGTMTRSTSDYRQMILQALRETRKEITVKFEILTKKNFIEALEKGCTLFHIDLYFEQQDRIIVEDDQLPLVE